MDKDLNNKPCESMSNPEEKLVFGADFVAMMSDIWRRFNELLGKTQSLSDRRFRIVDNGRIVAVFDRYVNIDCEALGKIPWLRDDDRIIVMADETRNGDKSVYQVYNVGSVPNVKYLGFAEADTYPTVTAVEQYTAKMVAQSEHRLELSFALMSKRIEALEKQLKKK